MQAFLLQIPLAKLLLLSDYSNSQRADKAFVLLHVPLPYKVGALKIPIAHAKSASAPHCMSKVGLLAYARIMTFFIFHLPSNCGTDRRKLPRRCRTAGIWVPWQRSLIGLVSDRS